MKYLSLFLIFCLYVVTTPPVLAQGGSYQVDALVSDGKKGDKYESTLSFAEAGFTVKSKKAGMVDKSFNYADVVTADYSYSKKPLMGTGAAIATAIFLGLLVIPFLFVKKKQHWLSVRTDKDYVVMRLDKDNFRQIQNEFEVKKVKITTIDEENEKKKDK